MPRSRSGRTLVGFLVLGVASLCPAAAARAGAPPHAGAVAADGRGALGLYVRGSSRLVPGTRAELRVEAHLATGPAELQPAAGVEVRATLSSPPPPAGKRARAAVPAAAAAARREVLLFSGRSDAQGHVEAAFTVPSWPAGTYQLALEARQGVRRVTEQHQVALAPGGRVLLQSDKPLYQPGQAVRLRAVVLRPLDGRPLGGDGSAAGPGVLFEVKDPRDNRVFQERRPLSRFGVAFVDFPLATGVLLGHYTVRASVSPPPAAGPLDSPAPPGELTVEVARYRLPRFQVELTTDREDYRPGQTLEARLAARYHFGKPVAGGEVTLSTRLEQGTSPGRLVGRLGADGTGRFRIVLPADGALGKIRIHASVVEAGGSGSRQEAHREVVLARTPLLLEVVSESGQLIPGLGNRLYVVATYRDGRPAAGARVEIALPGRGTDRAVTDALGVAEVERWPAEKPASGRSRCAYNHDAVKVRARDVAGFTAEVERCLRRAPPGTPLLRTARVLHGGGEAIIASVELAGGSGAPAPGTAVYVDLVKDGQIVETARVPVVWTPAGGMRGEVTLAPRAQRFGSLVVRGYTVRPDGRRHHDARLVLVERAGALAVTVQATSARRGAVTTLLPGEAARLHFKVRDGATGAPVKAQLGVQVVDEALLALRQVRRRSARLFFHLSREAAGAGQALAVRPAGLTVDGIVSQPVDEGRRQRAARVLFAGALVNAANDAFETSPWDRRREQAEDQDQRVGEALERHARTHLVGERIGGFWDYRRDLLDQMVRAGSLAPADRLDPWGRPIPRERVIRLSRLGRFEEHATAELERRLTRIYELLRRGRRGLSREASGRVVLEAADLDALVAARRLHPGERLDPWGTPFRVVEQGQGLDVIGIRSRFLVASAGPDRRPGTADDLYAFDVSCGGDRRVAGRPWKEATRVRMWGCGYGRGSGHGVGSAALRVASIGTRGHGSGQGAVAVRERFPETLLWKPDLVTDDGGDADLDVSMADSITTWQLFAEAVALDGRLGETTARVRVFQEFFAEVDLPPVATQNDELSVPVAVYNYLPASQRVTLELEDSPWFERLGDKQQVVELAPSAVGVRHFRVRLRGLGTRALTVHARGQSVADAVRRSIEVHPDGREHRQAWQALLQAGPGGASHAVEVPAAAISGTELAQLKIYPRTTTHVLEGLDSMLRMPSGCFEQTSSTTYPNALILDYLRQRGQATPELTRKALTYLQAGYQRLLSFEVRGGGFSWFGEAPANAVLTAYGVLEFHDMARVLPVDLAVIQRTQRWLMGRQAADGSFALDRGGINEGVTNGLTEDRVRIAAYIGGVLAQTFRSGSSPSEVRASARRAAAYVQRGLTQAVVRSDARRNDAVGGVSDGSAGRGGRGTSPCCDAYTLALAAQLFGATGQSDWEQAALARLGAASRHDPRGQRRWFEPTDGTPTHGRGASAAIETTAVAVQALLGPPGRRRPPSTTLDPLMVYLVGSKDALGNWHSTQATIQTLRALLAVDRTRKASRGQVTVEVNGRQVARVPVDAASATLTTVDLAGAARPGSHRVALRFEGQGEVSYQLVTGHHRPWERTAAVEPARGGSAEAAGLQVLTHVMGGGSARVGEELRAEVELTSRLDEAVDMPLLQAGLPPGFDLDVEALDQLVREGRVAKVERGAREVTFYLTRLAARGTVRLPLRLRARLPARVQMPAPLAYEYYRPERRAMGRPLTVTSLASR